MYQNNILKRIGDRIEEFCEDEVMVMALYGAVSVIAASVYYYKYGYAKSQKDIMRFLQKNAGKDLVFFNKRKYVIVKSGK